MTETTSAQNQASIPATIPGLAGMVFSGIQAFGFPTIVACFLLWVIHMSASTLVDRHIKFLDRTEEFMASYKEALRVHEQALQRVITTLEKQGEAIDALSKRIDSQTAKESR